MKLEDLNVYKISMDLADEIHMIVTDWESFYKYSIGRQLMEAADSVAANISEGFGRYHYKDHKNFLYFSRGSLYETTTWLTKSYRRNLIGIKTYNKLIDEYKSLAIKLNNYINSIGKLTINNK